MCSVVWDRLATSGTSLKALNLNRLYRLDSPGKRQGTTLGTTLASVDEELRGLQGIFRGTVCRHCAASVGSMPTKKRLHSFDERFS
jgi:hypothetical protein